MNKIILETIQGIIVYIVLMVYAYNNGFESEKEKSLVG